MCKKYDRPGCTETELKTKQIKFDWKLRIHKIKHYSF